MSKAQQEQKIKILARRREIETQYAIVTGIYISELMTMRGLAKQREQQKINADSTRASKDVFIIHGHNEAKLLELRQLLKDSFELNPIVLSEKPNQGLTIIEKFEKYASTCYYAFALFTPDDIVQENDGTTYFQARPNVIFEFGWFYAHLGRTRVCILDQASESSKIFSDLQGVFRLQFEKSIQEKFLDIQRELQASKIID